jgi:hypothetical protein
VKRATWELGEVGFLSLTEIGCDRGTCWRVDLRQGVFGEFGPWPRRVGFVCREMEGSFSLGRRGFSKTLGVVGEVECDFLISLTTTYNHSRLPTTYANY